MATGADNCNFIGAEVRRQGASLEYWSRETSQALAENIAKKVDPLKMNVRIVQACDNLGRIVEGLSGREIRLKDEGGEGWENIIVTYVGESAQIQDQRLKNPGASFVGASLIHPGQYVYLKNPKEVVVTDSLATFQDLK